MEAASMGFDDLLTGSWSLAAPFGGFCMTIGFSAHKRAHGFFRRSGAGGDR